MSEVIVLLPIRPSLRLLLLVAAGVALASCRPSTAPRTGSLVLTSDGTAVTLTNPKSWPVFYILADPGFLALADLRLCDDPASDCPRVAAGGTVRVPYGEITGYRLGAPEVQLLQWRLVPASGGGYEVRDQQSSVHHLTYNYLLTLSHAGS